MNGNLLEILFLLELVFEKETDGYIYFLKSLIFKIAGGIWLCLNCSNP